MFVKIAFSLLFTAAVACFGQVSVMGGYATTSGPATTTIPGGAANPPLVSTPDVALPGSGPAVGVPLSNTNPNDSRASTGPSIANPNSITLPLEGEGTSANEAPLAPSSAAPSANSGPFEFGIQRFGLEAAPVSNSTSLGEVARKYRSQHRPAVRTFTNDNIARLIAVAFQLGPLSTATPEQVASTPSSGPATDAAIMSAPDARVNQETAEDIPESDQDAAGPQLVEVALHQDATAAQQRHAGDAPIASDQSTTPAPGPTSPEGNPAGSRSHYSLPLVLLLGGLGVAVRVLFLILR